MARNKEQKARSPKLTKHGRPRLVLPSNPPKEHTGGITVLATVGKVTIYEFDGEYTRARLGFPDVGTDQFGTNILQ
jgi:ribosomal protein L30E